MKKKPTKTLVHVHGTIYESCGNCSVDWEAVYLNGVLHKEAAVTSDDKRDADGREGIIGYDWCELIRKYTFSKVRYLSLGDKTMKQIEKNKGFPKKFRELSEEDMCDLTGNSDD